MLLCYFLYCSLSVCLLWFVFHTIPDLYANLPVFYSKFPLLGLLMCFVTRSAHEWGRGWGLYGWRRSFCSFAFEIILACNLMCQPDARCQVPVRLPFLYGTGVSRYTDHSWVNYHDRGCNPTVYTALNMRNGFVQFFLHKLTQIHEYDQGFST